MRDTIALSVPGVAYVAATLARYEVAVGAPVRGLAGAIRRGAVAWLALTSVWGSAVS